MRNLTISLTAQERTQLQEIVALGEKKEQTKRAQVLLKLDQIPENKDWTYEKLHQELSYSWQSIRKLAERFANDGIDVALKRKGTPRYKDIVGQRFGRLVVVRPLPQRKGSFKVWECKCDCGNTVTRSTNQLIDYNGFNGAKSCGCIGHQDLSGMRFGRLMVLQPRPRENTGERVRWECKCDCGNTIVVRGSSLCNGTTKSCGCIKSEKRYNDLTGKKFGKLTAVEHVKLAQGQMSGWKCVCDCGNISFASTRDLMTDKRISCGCIIEEKARLQMEERNAKTIIDGTNVLLLCPKKPRKDSKSGIVGVKFDEARNKWYASISFKKKTYYLGRYAKKEDAIKARKRAEEELHIPFIEWFYSQNTAPPSSDGLEM